MLSTSRIACRVSKSNRYRFQHAVIIQSNKMLILRYSIIKIKICIKTIDKNNIKIMMKVQISFRIRILIKVKIRIKIRVKVEIKI